FALELLEQRARPREPAWLHQLVNQIIGVDQYSKFAPRRRTECIGQFRYLVGFDNRLGRNYESSVRSWDVESMHDVVHGVVINRQFSAWACLQTEAPAALKALGTGLHVHFHLTLSNRLAVAIRRHVLDVINHLCPSGRSKRLQNQT